MSSFDFEVELALPASRLWKALKDGENLFPKIAPQAMASIEHVAGPKGETGAIRIINFGPGVTVAPEAAFLKEKLVNIDPTTMTAVSTELEGGHLAAGFTKWQSTIKLTPIGEAKVKATFVVEHEGPGPVDVSVAQAKEGTPLLFKGIEAYLLSSGDYA